jgi:hypothetical protein
MSLTSFLRYNPDVRERFRIECPKPIFSIRKPLLAPPLSKRYALIGTAFDYLFRFYLERLNKVQTNKPWIAELAVIKSIHMKQFYKKGIEIINQARKDKANYLKTGKVHKKLITSVLLLAQLDPIYRVGIGYEYVGRIRPKDIKDIRRLIGIVNPRLFKAKKICLVNPTFGKASKLVEGADADIVIDDMLIDIKTTKLLELPGKTFQQLIGYYICIRSAAPCRPFVSSLTFSS